MRVNLATRLDAQESNLNTYKTRQDSKGLGNEVSIMALEVLDGRDSSSSNALSERHLVLSDIELVIFQVNV